MNRLERLRTFFQTPGPGETFHGAGERIFMRLAFAWLVHGTINWRIRFTDQPHPNGLADFIDFTFFSDPAVMGQIHAVTLVALVAYVVGIVPQLALAWTLFVIVGVGTLANSQGAIAHYTQIVALIVLAQCVAHWTRPRRLFSDPRTENRAIGWTLVTIAAGYVVCGAVKVMRSGGLWAWNSPMLAVQFVKTRQMGYFDRLEMPPADTWVDRMPELILAHPNAARLLFGAALVLELAGFVALMGRSRRALLGLALIAMHVSISLVMGHRFDTNIAALFIFLVNPVFWIALLGSRLRRPVVSHCANPRSQIA